MFGFFKALARTAVDLIVLPWLITQVIRTGRDKNRAQTIEIIARAAAAQVLAEFPQSEWAVLVDQIVRQLGDALPPSKAARAAAEARLTK